MSKKEILKYLLEINTDMSVGEILFCLVASFLLGLVIYFVYKKTFSGTVYSSDFNLSLILMSVITTTIMIVIGSNLALSLGLVGSLSIVRFRSAIKENKDLLFVFWAIANGLACGAEVFSVAAISVIFIAAIVLCMSGRQSGSDSYLLVVRGELESSKRLEEILQSNTKRYRVRMKTVGDTCEVTYEMLMKKGVDLDVFAKEIKKIDAVEGINIVSFNGGLIN